MKFTGGLFENPTNAYTWDEIGVLNSGWFSNGATIGCDTAEFMAGNVEAPTGIPDPEDFSCCKPILSPNYEIIGCTDPQAINYDAVHEGCTFSDPDHPLYGLEPDPGGNNDCCNYCYC